MTGLSFEMVLDSMGDQVADSEQDRVPPPAIEDQELEWTPDLALDVEAIDNDHRALFRYVREYMAAVDAEEGVLLYDNIFANLVEYTQTHFLREETVMEACGYPDLLQHRKEHARLARSVVAARNRHMLSPTGEFDGAMRAFLMAWLRHHIRKSDLRIRDWIPGRKAAIDAALRMLADR